MTKYQLERKNHFLRAITNYANAHGKTDANGNELSIYDMQYTADYLHRLETTLCRLTEYDCNGTMTKRDERKRERAEKRALDFISEKIGCTAYINGDPRGMQIRLYIKDTSTDNFYNCFDGETSGIDW